MADLAGDGKSATVVTAITTGDVYASPGPLVYDYSPMGTGRIQTVFPPDTIVGRQAKGDVFFPGPPLSYDYSGPGTGNTTGKSAAVPKLVEAPTVQIPPFRVRRGGAWVAPS